MNLLQYVCYCISKTFAYLCLLGSPDQFPIPLMEFMCTLMVVAIIFFGGATIGIWWAKGQLPSNKILDHANT